MKIYKPKEFARSARRALLNDNDLCAAVRRAEKGMIDADLGHGLIKQRIPRENKGRSGGFRSILFYKKGGMAVFLHLYAKSMRANVSASEQQVLEKLAKELKKLTPAQIKDLTATGRWEEVLDD